jgi:hypothetical protein
MYFNPFQLSERLKRDVCTAGSGLDAKLKPDSTRRQHDTWDYRLSKTATQVLLLHVVSIARITFIKATRAPFKPTRRPLKLRRGCGVRPCDCSVEFVMRSCKCFEDCRLSLEKVYQPFTLKLQLRVRYLPFYEGGQVEVCELCQ